MNRSVESPRPAWAADPLQSPEVVGLCLCQAADVATGRPAGIVVRDPLTQVARLIVASPGVDRRLIGARVMPDSAAGLACVGMSDEVIVATHQLLGRLASDRRRETEGLAYPIRAGTRGIGALVVFSPPSAVPAEAREQVGVMAAEAGPILQRALALRSDRERAMMDVEAGLPNRQGLEQGLQHRGYPPCALLRIELDQFGSILEQFGPRAAGEVLRHAGKVVGGVLRDDDVAAHLGGSAFALFLLGCTEEGGRIVAARVTARLDESPIEVAHLSLTLTCTLGLAAMPGTVAAIADLPAAAEAALRPGL